MNSLGKLILARLASVVFAVLLVAQPAAGAIIVFSLIASCAIVFGALLVILALKARRFASLLARS